MKRLLTLGFFMFIMVSCFIFTSCNGDGKSAYEIYCENHPDYTGTEAEWLESLKGADGKSAYEIYCEANPDYTGTEEEWILALASGEFVLVENHTVTFDLGYGSNKTTSTVKHGEKVARPDEPVRFGYEFLGWEITDGATNEFWSFAGYVVTEDITLTAKWDYLTYELPIVNIDTEGAGINSKEVYTDMTFDILNCDGELDGVKGGIRLRGNSTLAYDKKAYRIKFDKKQSLFGHESAKSWVLLAEYIDPSALHNYTAFSLGLAMDGLSFTPTPHKVNVYLNGEYRGLYTLCEQVQENKGRMDIELDEITDTMVNIKDYNFFICMDESVTGDASAVLDETYFYLEDYERYFELKYPEKSEFNSDEQFASFMTQLKAYVKDVMDAFNDKDIDAIRQEVNLNSLADFLIVDIIMGEQDHRRKSFNMYYTNTSDNPEENGKLNFGPIWDYDWSLNTVWTNYPNEQYEINDMLYYSNLFFKTMADVPELYDIVKERYNLYAKNALGEYIANFDNLYFSIKDSLKLNQELWYDKFDEELTDKNLKFLKDFLVARKTQLDALWG